jgi:NitT/TauT family transport system substrate-binding protein
MPKHVLKLTAAAAAIGITLAACGSSSKSAGAPSPASTQSSAANNPHVSIMVGGLAKQIYLPFKLTEQLGYFKQQGVNVSLLDEPAGVDATTSMLAGKVEGVGGFYDHTIDLQGLGKSAESVAQLLQTPGEVELCRNDLKGHVNSPADWKGRKLGVTDLGSSTDFLTQYLAIKNGLKTSDISRVGVQAGPTFIGAMTHSSIDCGMTTEPTVSALFPAQAYQIVDMRTAAGAQQALGGVYPATALYMSSSYVQAHPDTVQKLVNALVQTMHWINTHSATQIADQMPPDYYAGVGKAAYVQALDSEKGIFTPDGIMPANGPQTALNVLGAFDPNVKGHNIDLTKTFTTQFAAKANQTVGS